MNIIARKTSEFLSLRRESALCAFAMLGLCRSSFYMVRSGAHAQLFEVARVQRHQHLALVALLLPFLEVGVESSRVGVVLALLRLLAQPRGPLLEKPIALDVAIGLVVCLSARLAMGSNWQRSLAACTHHCVAQGCRVAFVVTLGHGDAYKCQGPGRAKSTSVGTG
jgi:hypothetical protein